jgi:signal transduction histidine kinase
VIAGVTVDDVTLVVLTLLGALPVVLIGFWLTRRGSGASATTQALVVGLAPVMATWVGAIVAARAMFVSYHDLTALLLIAVTAAAVALGASWLLSRRIRRDATALGELSARIGSGMVPDAAPAASVSELAAVGRQLADTSRRLDESQRRQQALERSRRELVAWVSHDLRSPLAGIRAMSEALEDGVVDDPDEVRGYLRAIGAETDRLTELVDDLFELSRITSGALDLRPREVAATDLLGPVLDPQRATARERGIELRTRLTDEAPLLVSPAEAARVVRNLVDNAIRHTPAGGIVVVGVAADGAEAVVSVDDECGGIPVGDLDRVFEVAFRGDAARTRGDDGGGGLGLAIAKGLAEAQDGTISVANTPGGCRFTVRFPLAGATRTPVDRP